MKIRGNHIIGGASGPGLLGLLGIQFARVRRDQNDKMAFAKALLFAQEEERKRIARDLHDGVGQSLLLLKKQLENAHEASLENRQMITETLEEARFISRDLHPFQLEKLGLTMAIEDIIEKVNRKTELFVSKELENIDDILSDRAEISVYRTVQEALSNIVKHAKPTAAKVSISKNPDSIIITVQDNGKGFDHELAFVKSKSMGLRTMAERISLIAGKINFETGSSEGSIVKCVVPISGNERVVE
jgi:signal transduction histidine kinase